MGVWPNRTRPVNRVCLARGSGWNRQPWMSRYHISSSQPRKASVLRLTACLKTLVGLQTPPFSGVVGSRHDGVNVGSRVFRAGFTGTRRVLVSAFPSAGIGDPASCLGVRGS